MAFLLQQLLRESARRAPAKEAVVCRSERLTYGELEESSNRLARFLLGHGVRAGDRVAIHLEKSVRCVVAMFGILKAGAAYVPVDPHAPPRRTLQILSDCGARALLTSARKARRLGSGLGETRVELLLLADTTAPETFGDRPALPWDAIEESPGAETADDGLVETDLAYILYTSGSTGQPKGVMLTHRNALTFLDWCADTFAIGADDRLSNHAPLHFDLSVFDVYGAIRAGATVYLIDEETVVFPAAAAAFLETNRITICYAVPSALVQLVLHGNLGGRRFPLRLLLYAGEPFPVKHLRALVALLPAVPIYNLYGPAETNVCTFFRLPVPLPEGMERVPIGRACGNCEVFALNEEGRRIGSGEEGELYVRGPSVTPGYWGDPEKTARAVLRHRERPHLDDRVYRTGDIVTLRDDGNYVFLGRRDHMIKSRGYRIELGEIEAALYAHPAVIEAAGVAIPDEDIGNRIRAFVVLAGDAPATEEELRRHCAQRLPAYMLPERLTLCPKLPKTSTGKIDRVRLVAEAGR